MINTVVLILSCKANTKHNHIKVHRFRTQVAAAVQAAVTKKYCNTDWKKRTKW